MTRALRTMTPEEQRAAVQRRIKEGHGGIGTCAAMDAKAIFDRQHKEHLATLAAEAEANKVASESASETQSTTTMPATVPGNTPPEDGLPGRDYAEVVVRDAVISQAIAKYMEEEDPNDC